MLGSGKHSLPCYRVNAKLQTVGQEIYTVKPAQLVKVLCNKLMDTSS